MINLCISDIHKRNWKSLIRRKYTGNDKLEFERRSHVCIIAISRVIKVNVTYIFHVIMNMTTY